MSKAAFAKWLVPAVTCLAAAIYLAGFCHRGWIPHDEGLLGQCAERVLAGELPHRDFDDTYTGGLSYFHAWMFQVAGVKLSTLRITLWLCSLPFFLAVYWIVARLWPAWVAGLATLACVVWSLPNWFAALPSWYILFCSTFGLVALLRYIDTRRRRWLLAAGAWGGIGLVFKIVALYYLAAAALTIIYCHQFSEVESAGARDRSRRLWPLCLVAAACSLIVAMLVVLLRRHLSAPTTIHFLLPILAICWLLVLNEWRGIEGRWSRRATETWASLAVLFAAAAIPVAVFAVPYAASGAIPELLRGVFVTPQLRLTQASFGLPGASLTILAVPVALAFLAGFWRWPEQSRGLASVAILVLAGLLYAARSPAIERILFTSLRCFTPLLIVASCGMLLWPQPRITAPQRQTLFLLTAMTAFLSLNQFPFSHPAYFCYCAPLVALTWLQASWHQPHGHSALNCALLVFLLLLGGLIQNQSSLFLRPEQLAVDPPVHRLEIPRAGLLVSRRDQATYMTLISRIHQHSDAGAWIYAAPECAEVYFLSERRNPTRTLFDFFDEREGSTDRLLRMLEDYRIRVVVINQEPTFSVIDHGFLQAVQRTFPQRESIGGFVLFCRDPVLATPDRAQSTP